MCSKLKEYTFTSSLKFLSKVSSNGMACSFEILLPQSAVLMSSLYRLNPYTFSRKHKSVSDVYHFIIFSQKNEIRKGSNYRFLSIGLNFRCILANYCVQKLKSLDKHWKLNPRTRCLRLHANVTVLPVPRSIIFYMLLYFS